jgi:hypothetical protein
MNLLQVLIMVNDRQPQGQRGLVPGDRGVRADLHRGLIDLAAPAGMSDPVRQESEV